MPSLFRSSHSSSTLVQDRKGFVAIIVVLLIGFITVVAAGILWLFVEENKASRLLSAGMTLQYGSEGAIEYALLKKKNHDHGFEDSMKRDESCAPSAQIRSADGTIPVMSQSLKVGYEMRSETTSQTGTLKPYEYLVIPLYTDKGISSSTTLNSSCKGAKDFKKYTVSDTSSFTKDFRLVLTPVIGSDLSKVTWNILASSGATSDTVGLVGSGSITDSTTSGVFRSTQEDGGDTSKQKYVVDKTGVKISDFLDGKALTPGTPASISKPFLILFNNQVSTVNYSLDSLPVAGIKTAFSSPRPCITATAELGSGINRRGQFYEFCQNNSDLLEGLKYSFFSF